MHSRKRWSGLQACSVTLPWDSMSSWPGRKHWRISRTNLSNSWSLHLMRRPEQMSQTSRLRPGRPAPRVQAMGAMSCGREMRATTLDEGKHVHLDTNHWHVITVAHGHGNMSNAAVPIPAVASHFFPFFFCPTPVFTKP